MKETVKLSHSLWLCWTFTACHIWPPSHSPPHSSHCHSHVISDLCSPCPVEFAEHTVLFREGAFVAAWLGISIWNQYPPPPKEAKGWVELVGGLWKAISIPFIVLYYMYKSSLKMFQGSHHLHKRPECDSYIMYNRCCPDWPSSRRNEILLTSLLCFPETDVGQNRWGGVIPNRA